MGLLFVILLCESELEIQRKEGGRLPLDSRKLLNHLEKEGGVVRTPPNRKDSKF